MPSKKKVSQNPMKQNWEIKDRFYRLKKFDEKGDKPAGHILKNRNCQWYDPDQQAWREIQYATNQKSIFVDEFTGKPRLGHIIFRDGELRVDERDHLIQKFLLIHPDRDRKFIERDESVIAEDEYEVMIAQNDAVNKARELDIDSLEAIVRTQPDTDVDTMSVKEIKRDAVALARKNPVLFMDLANDAKLKLRNLAIKAVNAGLLTLEDDNRTFLLTSTGKKIYQAPFDLNPYKGIANWLQSDDGLDVLDFLEKKVD